jgi:tetratricopeptide (TPR) repeat protein
MLRLASCYSALGKSGQAVALFTKAAQLAPQSPDVRVYLGLHYARTPQWERAVPLLEQAVAESPDRLPAVEGLSVLRERQGRVAEAVDLRRRVYELRDPSRDELLRTGQMAMEAGRTDAAIEAFERARAMSAPFDRELELGVLYLDARRFADARSALDRVRPDHPEYAMALFKRAQVSVLLNEPDASARIEKARRDGTAETRALIARERLFQGR